MEKKERVGLFADVEEKDEEAEVLVVSGDHHFKKTWQRRIKRLLTDVVDGLQEVALILFFYHLALLNRAATVFSLLEFGDLNAEPIQLLSIASLIPVIISHQLL